MTFEEAKERAIRNTERSQCGEKWGVFYDTDYRTYTPCRTKVIVEAIEYGALSEKNAYFLFGEKPLIKNRKTWRKTTNVFGDPVYVLEGTKWTIEKHDGPPVWKKYCIHYDNMAIEGFPYLKTAKGVVAENDKPEIIERLVKNCERYLRSAGGD